MSTGTQTASLPKLTSIPKTRLQLGMANVGFWVALSVLGLLTVAPQPAESLSRELATLMGYLGVYVVLSLPFDWIGAELIPQSSRAGNPKTLSPLRRWLRGTLTHVAVLWLIGTLWLLAGRYTGPIGIAAVPLVLVLLLVLLQARLAKTIAPLTAAAIQSEKPDAPIQFDSADPAFSGGITGIPRFERIVHSTHWKHHLSSSAFHLLERRRELAIHSGHRTRGLLTAAAWVVFGALGAFWLTGASITTASDLLRLAFATTLWQFLGLLLLPTPTRQAALHLDSMQLRDGVPESHLRDMITQTAPLLEAETTRTPIVERFFHPVPSTNARLQSLGNPVTKKGTWNANRLMLYLAWASLGLLSRAVHCNIGRPELWVMPPVD